MSDVKQNLNKGKEFVIFEKEKIGKKREERKKRKSIKDIKSDDLTKLDSLAKMTTNRLFIMRSIWPFDLFPNKVVIEEKQVILYYKQFFFTTQEYHILIQDILVPIVENSFLFATLRIQIGTGGFQQDPPPIQHLPKKDALMAKRIIMGLLVCHKENLSLDDLEKEELVKKLIEIGRYKKE